MTQLNELTVTELIDAIKRGRPVRGSISIETLAELNKRLMAEPSFADKMRSFVIIYGMDARDAIVAFPELSITRLNVRSRTRLRPDQFSLILNSPEIVGDVLPRSWKNRISEEGKHLGYAFGIAVVAFLINFIVANDAAYQYHAYLLDPDASPMVTSTVNFFQTIGQALLTVITLFLSVFVLFTISQNSLLTNDISLYRNGTAHKYMRDDRYVAMWSGVSLICVLLGLAFTSMPHEVVLANSPLINKINGIIPFLYSIASAGFYVAISSLSYYSERALLSNEAKLMKMLLQEKLSKTANTKPENTVGGDTPSDYSKTDGR